jgi:hypothetical protein
MVEHPPTNLQPTLHSIPIGFAGRLGRGQQGRPTEDVQSWIGPEKPCSRPCFSKEEGSRVRSFVGCIY